MRAKRVYLWPRLRRLHWAMHPTRGKISVKPKGQSLRLRKCPCECGSWLIDWRGEAYLVKAKTLVVSVEETTPGADW